MPFAELQRRRSQSGGMKAVIDDTSSTWFKASIVVTEHNVCRLTWNSLPPAVLNCDSLLSNPDLKLFCFLPLSANYSTYLFRQCLSASEMTYIVSSGALNSTHSLTRQCLCCRLTALWCYINFVLLLLLITIIVIIKQQFVRQSNMARVTTGCRWKRQNIHSLRCSVADTDAVDYTV